MADPHWWPPEPHLSKWASLDATCWPPHPPAPTSPPHLMMRMMRMRMMRIRMMRMMGMMLSMMDITSGVPILPSLRCQHTKPDGDIQYKKIASICLKPKSFALFDFQNLKETFPFWAFHNVAPGNFHLKLDSQMTGGMYIYVWKMFESGFCSVSIPLYFLGTHFLYIQYLIIFTIFNSLWVSWGSQISNVTLHCRVCSLQFTHEDNGICRDSWRCHYYQIIKEGGWWRNDDSWLGLGSTTVRMATMVTIKVQVTTEPWICLNLTWLFDGKFEMLFLDSKQRLCPNLKYIYLLSLPSLYPASQTAGGEKWDWGWGVNNNWDSEWNTSLFLASGVHNILNILKAFGPLRILISSWTGGTIYIQDAFYLAGPPLKR